MEISQIYVLIGILALAVIAVVMFFIRGKKSNKKMTKLSQLAFVFIFAGIIFGESRFIGYSLMTFGGILALVDVVRKSKLK